MKLLGSPTCRSVSGGHLAVGGVTLRVDGGRICGLIGPNGAGRPPPFNTICGVINPTSGRRSSSTARRVEDDTHQRSPGQDQLACNALRCSHRSPCATTSVSAWRSAGGWSRRRAPLRPSWPTAPTSPRSTGRAGSCCRLQLTELARASVGSRRPARPAWSSWAGRWPPGCGAAARRTRLGPRRARDGGLRRPCWSTCPGPGSGILLVEHDISLVMRVCEHLSVLDFGQVIAAGNPDEIRSTGGPRCHLGAPAGDDDLVGAAAIAEAAGHANGHGPGPGGARERTADRAARGAGRHGTIEGAAMGSTWP